jgi:hypothetical protein
VNNPEDPWLPRSFIDPPPCEDDDHGIYAAPEPFRPHWLAWGVAAVLMVLVGWVLMVVIRG